MTRIMGSLKIRVIGVIRGSIFSGNRRCYDFINRILTRRKLPLQIVHRFGIEIAERALVRAKDDKGNTAIGEELETVDVGGCGLVERGDARFLLSEEDGLRAMTNVGDERRISWER